MSKEVFNEVYEGLPYWLIKDDIVELITQSVFQIQGKQFRVIIEQIEEDK